MMGSSQHNVHSVKASSFLPLGSETGNGEGYLLLRTQVGY